MPKIDRDRVESQGEFHVETCPVLWEHHELALRDLRGHGVDALPQSAAEGRAGPVVTRPAFRTSALIAVASRLALRVSSLQAPSH
jgi:hypothetical protein